MAAAVTFPGRLAKDRHVCNFRGICGVEREFAIIRSPTQQAVSAGAGRGLSGGDHRQSGAAGSRGSCNPLCRVLGRLCVV